jgi:hypothetical protein
MRRMPRCNISSAGIGFPPHKNVYDITTYRFQEFFVHRTMILWLSFAFYPEAFGRKTLTSCLLGLKTPQP